MHRVTRAPLVVDLDGTLTPTDTLIESVIKLAKQSPWKLVRATAQLLKGRAAFKAAMSATVSVSAEGLPYREPLVEYLRSEKAHGRRIVLATAAHDTVAQAVAIHLGVFDDVLSTTADRNLKGASKLEAIRERVGHEFVYAGDSRADLPIWKASNGAVLVGATPGLARSVRRMVSVETEFPAKPTGLRVWLRALRVHQWLKNLLLFTPLVTAFSFLDVRKLAAIVVAFLAFSLAASGTYILNDLWDLESDRAHARKRLRPFASGQIPLVHGLVAALGAVVLAVALGLVVSREFLIMLLVYLALTSMYSWVLKGIVLVDVIVLSVLYTWRILAGSVAVQIATSSWLLAFSVFLFLSLALVKRCAELVSAEHVGRKVTTGRDYRTTDLVVLYPLGVGAALSALVVFGLFVSAPDTIGRYRTPQMLWLVALALVYWLARLWIKTSRGEMHDDPLVYAMKDRSSRLAVVAMLVAMLVAHFFTLPFVLSIR